MDTSVLNELVIKRNNVSPGQHGRATPNDTVALVSNVPHIIEESYVVRDHDTKSNDGRVLRSTRRLPTPGHLRRRRSRAVDSGW